MGGFSTCLIHLLHLTFSHTTIVSAIDRGRTHHAQDALGTGTDRGRTHHAQGATITLEYLLYLLRAAEAPDLCRVHAMEASRVMQGTQVLHATTLLLLTLFRPLKGLTTEKVVPPSTF